MRRRTKFAAAVVMMASGTGCPVAYTSNPPPPDEVDAPMHPPTENPPPPGPRVESYDVLVSAQTVRILPRFAAETPGCMLTGVDVLPDLGQCRDQPDVISIPCGLAVDVTQLSIDGAVAAIDPQTASAALVVNAGASSVLRLDGRFGAVDVPLHATGLPTPTLTTTPRSNGVDIAWTTDVQAASTLVEVTAGLTVRHCQVTQPAYRFDGPTPSAIRVQPFLPVETTTTPYGDVRVWRGNGRAAD